MPDQPVTVVPDTSTTVPNPDTWFTKIKGWVLSVLTHWQVWIVLVLLVLLGLSEWRNRSIQSKWQKSIESEVKKQTSQIVQDQQDKQVTYEKGLRDIQKKLSALEKSRVAVDNKISKTEQAIEKVRKEKLSRSDIDRRLNELFPKGGSVGTSF